MFLFDFFRSFLPLHNPIGFGAADFIELILAVLLVFLLVAQAQAEPWAQKLAARTGWCMLLLAMLPLVLRLALLPHSPIPTPAGSDDFSYVLLADTLRHFRMANPAHPLSQFFEAVFILQQPAYASIFPLGQGLVMAFGWMLFGAPWSGVALSVAALCALCYWMLRGWTTPGWALVGGLLAVMEFGPLTYWMNTYWGGAVSAVGGCLVFGALPRLRTRRLTRDAVALAAGLSLQLLTRPFEFALLTLAIAAYLLLTGSVRKLLRPLAIALLFMLPALGLMLIQNRQVTGKWTSLPYELSRYQYGVPTTFAFQPNPEPHRELTKEQQLDYRAQSTVHDGPEFFARLWSRTGYYRFFFLPPLYLALPFFLLMMKDRRLQWVAGTLVLFAVGDNFYPYFYPHYIAALTCLFVLVSVTALARLSQWNSFAARLIVILCAAHFLFWYGVHATRDSNVRLALHPYEAWDFINEDDPEGRIAINRRLDSMPGQQLVFVRYSDEHGFHEWIHNAADIDGSQIVWALDLSPEENRKLIAYYPSRTAWIVEPDALPPRLSRYR